MNKIYIEYLCGCFDEKEVTEITQLCKTYDVEASLCERRPCIVNAALDELVETVLLFVNSAELQTSISIFNVGNSISHLVKWMWEKLKSKKTTKLTSNTVEKVDANIIVRVNNVKILFKKNMTDEELSKYLHVALCESKRAVQVETNCPIVIDGDNDEINVYYLEEFAKKAIGTEYNTIRSVSYRKYSRRKHNAKIR